MSLYNIKEDPYLMQWWYHHTQLSHDLTLLSPADICCRNCIIISYDYIIDAVPILPYTGCWVPWQWLPSAPNSLKTLCSPGTIVQRWERTRCSYVRTVNGRWLSSTTVYLSTKVVNLSSPRSVPLANLSVKTALIQGQCFTHSTWQWLWLDRHVYKTIPGTRIHL